MALIEERPTKSGKPVYRVKIRIKGFPPETASFQRKTDAVRWAKETEAAILQGRHFKTGKDKEVHPSLSLRYIKYYDEFLHRSEKTG